MLKKNCIVRIVTDKIGYFLLQVITVQIIKKALTITENEQKKRNN
jgi:hypothetical protein